MLIRMVIYHRLTGPHVHVRIFCGPREGSRVQNGELIFNLVEWELFRNLLGEHARLEYREEL